MSIDPKEFGELVGTVKAMHGTVKAIDGKLDTQNGRVDLCETNIALLNQAVYEIKPEVKATARKVGGWTAGVISGVILLLGAVGGLVFAYLRGSF